MKKLLALFFLLSGASIAHAQQYINFSYAGAGLASGEDSTVKVMSLAYSAKIERKQVSGSTHFILTVLSCSRGGAINFSPDVGKDPGLLCSPGGELFPSQTADLGTAPSTITVSVFQQITSSSFKYHFGQQTGVAISVPKTSTTAAQITNPYTKDLHVIFRGIKADGTTDVLQTGIVPAGATTNFQIQGDATRYSGGVNVQAYYENTTLDGSGNLVDGTGNQSFNLNSIGWELPLDYDPTGTSTTPIRVDTSDSSVPNQVRTANTTNNNVVIGGASHITNNNVYGAGGTATDALTKGAMQVIGNGLIDAINYNGDQIARAVKAISITGGSGGTTDMSGTNSRLDTLHTDVTGTNTKLDTLITKETDKATAVSDGQTAATAAGTAAGAAIPGSLTTATTGASGTNSALAGTSMWTGGATLVASSPMLGDNGYATTTHVATVDGPILSGVAGGTSLDVNPFTSDALARVIGAGNALKFCNWIRSFIAWASVIAFFNWLAHYVYRSCVAMATTPGMTTPTSTMLLANTSVLGTSVGVIPAGTLYALQVVAWSTLILGMPVAIVAAYTAAGGLDSIVSAGTAAASSATSSPGSFLMNSLSYSYIILPVVLLITIALNTLVVRLTSITQVVVTAVVLKIASI
ncbi:MAG TPA: hypothetical protein VG838_13755 [Opitutaceae bacterium]|nr:hypothetical protein [Opitutaceae bacterium]